MYDANIANVDFKINKHTNKQTIHGDGRSQWWNSFTYNSRHYSRLCTRPRWWLYFPALAKIWFSHSHGQKHMQFDSDWRSSVLRTVHIYTNSNYSSGVASLDRVLSGAVAFDFFLPAEFRMCLTHILTYNTSSSWIESIKRSIEKPGVCALEPDQIQSAAHSTKGA